MRPRPTPEERPDVPVEVDVDDALSVHVATLGDSAAPRPFRLDVELHHILTFT